MAGSVARSLAFGSAAVSGAVYGIPAAGVALRKVQLMLMGAEAATVGDDATWSDIMNVLSYYTAREGAKLDDMAKGAGQYMDFASAGNQMRQGATMDGVANLVSTGLRTPVGRTGLSNIVENKVATMTRQFLSGFGDEAAGVGLGLINPVVGTVAYAAAKGTEFYLNDGLPATDRINLQSTADAIDTASTFMPFTQYDSGYRPPVPSMATSTAVAVPGQEETSILSQFAVPPDDMGDPRYMFAALSEITQSGAGIVAGLADAMLTGDSSYKAQFANPTADTHISYIEESAETRVLAQWLSKQSIIQQFFVQMWGVTMGADYAQVYTIVNDILDGYRKSSAGQLALGDGSSATPASVSQSPPMPAWLLKQELISVMKQPKYQHLHHLMPREGGAATDRARENTQRAVETTVGAMYNAMPEIEDALHAAGWVMMNILFPGISFGDNVIAATS